MSDSNSGYAADATAQAAPQGDAQPAAPAAKFAPKKLPRGILPDGIAPPPGTDIMQFIRDLAESGADFTEQFDRNSATYHNGIITAVPTGGARVPEEMAKGGATADWSALPVAPLAIEEDFGPEYNDTMKAHKTLGDCKKAISVLNKPVEMAMRCRLQYKGATGEDETALKARLKGAEDVRDGALSSATQTILDMSDNDVSERTRSCVKDVVDRGKFHFEDKETFGEYMQVLQRANQAIFADQTKLLKRMKDIKKAAKTTQVYDAPASKGPEDAAVVAAGA